MENIDLCTVLVTSCDKYDDAWYPFFSLFHIMWPDCPYAIRLNTESKDYSFPGINVKPVHPYELTDNKGKNISWSRRLKEVIEQIDSKYILFFLEDFFLMSPVRSDIVDDCITWMEEEDSIGVIDFYPERHQKEVYRREFSQIDSGYDYCINAMTALWRKDFLLSMLRDENPWDFEFFGTERWRRTNVKIFTHRSEFPVVFDYAIKPYLGYGIYQGKWLRKNKELFNQYGIEVDFDRRGFIDPPDLIGREREKNWLLHDMIKTLRNPGLIYHYMVCVKNVSKDKIRRFKAKHCNR